MSGTIDQLNFEIILDDKEFDAKVKADIKLANELNTSLSSLLTIKSKVGKFNQDDVVNNRKANQILVDNLRAQEKITREKIKTQGVQDKINAQIQSATRGYQTQSRILGEIKNLALGYLSVHGAGQLLSSLVKVTGEFELQKTTLAAMLGDLNKAEQVITKIQGLAVESPFQFKELSTYAKQLSAFSVPAEELFETTKMLADISAGLGVGMDRIVLAYGQVRSAAFLRGQEVRQFTEAGIPILDMLAKQFEELEGQAVSTGEVFDRISARLVPFEMVAKAFKDMTSEGGKFYNMQEIQAETLKGKISNLKDAYEVMLNEIGTAQSEKLKGAVDQLRRLMQNYEEVGKSIMSLVVIYGTYKASLMALGALTDTFSMKNFGLLSSFKSLGQWITKNPYALLAAGIGTMAGLIYKAATEQTTFEKSLAITNETVADFNKNVNAEQGLLKYLLDRLGKLTVGTSEYNKVKSQILRDYGQYLTEVDKENLAIGELSKVYDNLKESIREANKEKAIAEGNAKFTAQYTATFDDVFNKFNQTIDALGIEGKDLRQALGDFVRGDIGLEDLPEEALKAVNEAKSRINQAAYTSGGMFGSGISFAGFDFEVLRNQLKEAEDIVEDARVSLSEKLEVMYGPMPKAADPVENLKDWQKLVNETLTKFNLDSKMNFGLWTKETTRSTEYVDNLIKRYKELKEEIKNVSSFDKEQADRLKRNKEAIEAVAKALKLDIQDLAANKSDKKESKEERYLKGQIDLVNKLKDAYEKLRVYLTDGQLRAVLANLFPAASKELIQSFDFTGELESLFKKLEKYDKDAANKFRATMGKDVAGNLVSAFKEVENYKKMLDEWLGQDFNLTGEGITYDVNKIVRDLNNQYNQIDQKRLKAIDLLKKAQEGGEEELKIVRQQLGEEAWESYLTNGIKVIDELARKERESAKKVADERIKDKANSYLKELLDEKNINLTDFGDKTMAQIRTMIGRLEDIKKGLQIEMGNVAQQIWSEDVDSSQMAYFEMLLKVIEMLGVKIDDVNIEFEKSLFKTMEDGLDNVSSLASEITRLGEAMSIPAISGFGKIISGLSSTVTNLLPVVEDLNSQIKDMGFEGLKDWGKLSKEQKQSLDFSSIYSAIAAVATTVISHIADVIATAREHQVALNEAAWEYYEAQLEIRRASQSNIFGTNEMALAVENYKILEEAQNKYSDALDKFENEMKLRQKKYADILITNKKLSVSQIMVEIAEADEWQLYRENGELNMDSLIAYYDSYADKLTNKQRDVVDELIASYNAQDEAARQSAEYLTSLFSGVADSIADNMISSFLETGDALGNLQESFTELGESIVKSMLKSVIIDEVLNKYQDRVNEIFSQAESLNDKDMFDQLAGVFGEMEKDFEKMGGWLNPLLEYLQELGIVSDTAESGVTDMGEGIKGITEDQANLLNSYVNAIRADIASQRMLLSHHLPIITDAIPTLMEYQARIAANTYDTAVASQSLLAEIRSVVTSDGGDAAIRVYS